MYILLCDPGWCVNINPKVKTSRINGTETQTYAQFAIYLRIYM